MTDCPHCRRRLLSHASAKCNWCGEMIGDAEYQTHAQVEREAYFTHQAQHDAQSLANIDAINVNAYDPFLNPLTSTPMQSRTRRGTPIRPLTYENQPQPTRAEPLPSSPWPVDASKKSEPEHPAPAMDQDESEAGQQGRFGHLEL